MSEEQDISEDEKEVLDVLKKNTDIINISELVLYLPYGRTTFYERGLNNSNNIKKALDNNKLEIKKELRTNWRKKNASPVLQISLYKLLANEDELKRLNNEKDVAKELVQYVNNYPKLAEALNSIKEKYDNGK